jgi:hypothetical protein
VRDARRAGEDVIVVASKKKSGKGSGQAERQRQQKEAAARRRGAGGRPADGQGREGPAAPAAPSPATRAAVPADGQVRRYLDVSAVRIQEWLARTPDLRFRRGASVLLTEATAREETEKDLPAGVGWNEEAGEVDGVVSLVTDDGPEADALVGEAARQVAGRMRAKMPYIHIQAVTGTGQAYADAYEEMGRARRDGGLLFDVPPAPREVILAKPCDQCRSAAALHPEILIIAGERPQDLCEECRGRFLAAGGTKGDSMVRSPLPERRMMAALAKLGMPVSRFSDHFAAMAEAGQTRADDVSSQLALISADGNRVGAFLHEAVQHAGGRRGIDKREIVRVISDATVGALADAVAGRFRDWPRPPVLAHIAGGDDLLISVPAADAWLFTRMLLAAFTRRVSGESRDWPQQVRDACPSLSAGLVFHHLKHPFSDLVRVGHHELDTAKKTYQGRQAAVSFLDLTADGGQAPDGREPLTLTELDRLAGDLERIEQIPPSRRQALLALLRQDAADDLIRRVTDFADNQPLWNVIAGTGAKPDDVRKELGDPAKRAELRRLLDIARHWMTQPRPPDEPRTGRHARAEDAA